MASIQLQTNYKTKEKDVLRTPSYGMTSTNQSVICLALSAQSTTAASILVWVFSPYTLHYKNVHWVPRSRICMKLSTWIYCGCHCASARRYEACLINNDLFSKLVRDNKTSWSINVCKTEHCAQQNCRKQYLFGSWFNLKHENMKELFYAFFLFKNDLGNWKKIWIYLKYFRLP